LKQRHAVDSAHAIGYLSSPPLRWTRYSAFASKRVVSDAGGAERAAMNERDRTGLDRTGQGIFPLLFRTLALIAFDSHGCGRIWWKWGCCVQLAHLLFSLSLLVFSERKV